MIIEKIARKTVRALFKYDPTFVDWYQDSRFKETGTYYLEKIFSVLKNYEKMKGASIVDLGCQAGRIIIPLLQAGFKDVCGVDQSRMAIHYAQKNLEKMNLYGSLKKMDLKKYIRNASSGSVDVIISIEVLYLCFNFLEIMANISRLLRSNGYLIATFKSKAYFFTRLLEKENFKMAKYVLEHSEGEVKDLGKNWQSKKELLGILEQNGIQCKLHEFYYHLFLNDEKLKKYLTFYPDHRSLLDFLEDKGQEIVIVGQKQ